MQNNRMYFITGILVMAVIGLGAWIYQEQQRPSGVDISIGKGGVSIESR